MDLAAPFHARPDVFIFFKSTNSGSCSESYSWHQQQLGCISIRVFFALEWIHTFVNCLTKTGSGREPHLGRQLLGIDWGVVTPWWQLMSRGTGTQQAQVCWWQGSGYLHLLLPSWLPRAGQSGTAPGGKVRMLNGPWGWGREIKMVTGPWGWTNPCYLVCTAVAWLVLDHPLQKWVCSKPK